MQNVHPKSATNLLHCSAQNVLYHRNRNHTESMLPPTQDRRPSTMSKMIVVIGRQPKTEMSLVCV